MTLHRPVFAPVLAFVCLCLPAGSSLAAALTPGNIVVVSKDALREITPTGNTVQQFEMPPNDDGVLDPHNLTVTPDGRVVVLNGRTSRVTNSVAVLDPATEIWQHFTDPSFEFTSFGDSGGVAADNEFAFIPLDAASARGLARLDLTDGTVATNLGDFGFSDIDLGVDGLVYAQVGNGVERYDPVTLEQLDRESVDGPGTLPDNFAMSRPGDFYFAAATFNAGSVYRYSATGDPIDEYALPLARLDQYYDIDFGPDDRLVLTTEDGEIFVTNRVFESPQRITPRPVRGAPAYAAFVPLPDPDGDADGDGIRNLVDNCVDLPNGPGAGPDDQADNDDDGLGDACDEDDDNDGMTDEFETANGLDSLDPSDAPLDADGDGASNLIEYLGGTDPLDGGSVPDVITSAQESFEDTDLPPGWRTAPGSNGEFGPTTDRPRTELQSLTHSVIGEAGTAAVEWTGLFEAGELAFDVFTDLPTDDDRLELLVDGGPVLEAEFGGPWEAFRVPLAAGEHTIRWEYRQSVGSRGKRRLSALYLDNVAFYPPDEDTDADGIANASDNCLLAANPSQTDLDADGLGNACDPDNDGDDISDDYELAEGLAVNDASDRLADADGDRITNLYEATEGLSASNPDTDLDGLPDDYEFPGLRRLLPDFGDSNGEALFRFGLSPYGLSANGRFLGFGAGEGWVSDDSDSGLYIYDRLTGAFELMLGNDGSVPDEGASSVSISDDGRYVLFQSRASNLLEDGLRNDLYLYDRVPDRILGVGAESATGGGGPTNPIISGNGRYAVYVGVAGTYQQVLRRDLLQGTVATVSRGDRGVGNEASGDPAISSDGSRIVYSSGADNLVDDDTNGEYDIFLYDDEQQSTTLISRYQGVAGDGDSILPRISRNGRFVTFVSRAENLSPDDVNGFPDVFLYDHDTGVIERVTGTQVLISGSDLFSPIVMNDGTVYFETPSRGLDPEDTNRIAEVYAYDPTTRSVRRIAASTAFPISTQESLHSLAASENGFLVFETDVEGFVPGDDLEFDQDIFIGKLAGELLDPWDPSDVDEDFDGDGLSNGEEYAAGADPWSADSDGDGLSDPEELGLGTDLAAMDSDQDGLTDGFELGSELPPVDADQDDDGLGDGLEDHDRDGILTVEEQSLGTDPRDWDTDGDRLPDGYELLFELDPTDPADGPAQFDDVVPLEGISYLSVDSLRPNEASGLTTMLAGPGTLSFEWRILDNEDTASGLAFLLVEDPDNALAEVELPDWAPVEFDIPPGDHYVSWVYAKLSIGQSGDDVAYVRNIVYEPSPNVPNTREDVRLGFINPNRLSAITSGNELWASSNGTPPPSGGGGGGGGGSGGGGGASSGGGGGGGGAILWLLPVLAGLRRRSRGIHE